MWSRSNRRFQLVAWGIPHQTPSEGKHQSVYRTREIKRATLVSGSVNAWLVDSLLVSSVYDDQDLRQFKTVLEYEHGPREGELFCYLTCLHTTIFVLLSVFSLEEEISLKIDDRERPLSWQAKC